MTRAHVAGSSSAGFGCFETGLRAGESGSAFREEHGDRKIEFTIAYMMEHLNQSLPVAKLAALANMSPSHYTARFKRRTGCAPIDYFIRLRMRHARALLIATSLNVKELAAVVGYEDPFYFSRVFKSVTGLAPRDFRNRVLGASPVPSSPRDEGHAKNLSRSHGGRGLSHRADQRSASSVASAFIERIPVSNPALANTF